MFTEGGGEGVTSKFVKYKEESNVCFSSVETC